MRARGEACRKYSQREWSTDSGLRIGSVLLDCAVTDVVLLSAKLLECYVGFKSICTFCLKVSAILLHMTPSFLTKAPLYKHPMSAAVRWSAFKITDGGREELTSVELIIISACSEEGFSWLSVSIDHAIAFQGELKENEIKETEIAFLKVYC